MREAATKYWGLNCLCKLYCTIVLSGLKALVRADQYCCGVAKLANVPSGCKVGPGFDVSAQHPEGTLPLSYTAMRIRILIIVVQP